MRQLIKARAFQEPIHEDAPGFNANQGHKNLITELNEEVLPKLATDLIGPATATSDEYQFRRNAAGNLEFFLEGEWTEVQGSGAGGGGETTYVPTRRARVQVSAPFSTDCFVYADIETTLSAQGRDFRVYQYGLPRACVAYVLRPGVAAGSVVYRVTFEASLTAGVNDIEIRYGDPLVGYGQEIPWSILGQYEVLHGAWEPADGYAILRPRVNPSYLPVLRNWTEALAFGDSQVATNINPQGTPWNFPQQYWNANRKTWVTPRLTGFCLDLRGDVTNNWTNNLKGTIGIRRSNYGSSYSYAFHNVRVKQTQAGNFYGIRTSWSSWPNNDDFDGFDVFGLLNNGHWLFANYKHHNYQYGDASWDVFTSYGMDGGQFHYWPDPEGKRQTWAQVVSTYGGLPETRVFVPLLQSTVLAADEVLA